MCCAQPRSVKLRFVGHRYESVSAASMAGPGGIVAVSPKNDTGTPLADRSRSPTSAMIPPFGQSLAEHLGRTLSPGQRQDLHPQRLPVGDELLVQGLGFEPFDHGGHRPPAAGDPHPGHIPVARVGDHQHDALALLEGPVDVLGADRPGLHLLEDLVVIHRGQPEGLLPVPGVRAHPGLDDGGERGGRRLIPQHPVQVLGQLHDARPASPERGVGRLPEDPVGDRIGQVLGQRPTCPESEVGEPIRAGPPLTAPGVRCPGCCWCRPRP